MKNLLLLFSVFSLIGLLCFTSSCKQQGEENKSAKVQDLDKIPMAVSDGLNARFPRAQIHKWSKEKEGDILVYDIEFKQDGRKLEADITENGTICNWEKAIEAGDLPEAVKKTVQTKFPGSAIKETMENTVVKDGKDALEGYEIVLQTADNKEVEITVAPDGRIIEESGK